ncbi:MAG: dephospho-CoA kinase [Thomasclavelia sp.]|nr:dephospho-CoA kinase [Thomasclavelia sp.]
MKVIGITGGIACGKSEVTSYLTSKGYVVIDSDKLVNEAYQDSDIKNKLEASFHTLDKKSIGQVIFNDTNKKKTLENIIHPFVIEGLKKGIQTNQNQDLIFLDIPLLYESNLEYLCDKVIVVSITLDNQIKRLCKRDNIDPNYARIKIDSQMRLKEKEKRADYVLDNNHSLDDLYHQIDMILKGEER